MNTRNYWYKSFQPSTWQEFLVRGANIAAFPQRSRKTVQQLKPEDFLICYVADISRWIGVLEVISHPFEDSTPISKEGDFLWRVPVNLLIGLTPETAVPLQEVRDQLSFYDLHNLNASNLKLHQSLFDLEPKDAEVIMKAIREAHLRSIQN